MIRGAKFCSQYDRGRGRELYRNDEKQIEGVAACEITTS